MYNIGIDIGGTSIKIGVVLDQEIIERYDIKTINDDIDKLLDEIFLSVDELLKKYEIKNIGIGVPGKIINNKIHAPNIKFNDVNLIDIFKQRYDNINVEMLNDAKAAAVVEILYGSLKETSGIFLTFGTGIGGAIIIDGKLYEGTNNNAAEIGHQIINVDGKKCTCGSSGCYEMYGSTKALIDRAKERLKDSDKSESTIFNYCDTLDEITGKSIFKAYHDNDEFAMNLIDEHTKYMAIGIVNLLNILDVNNIIIGGGISKESEVIIPKLKEYISKYKTLDESNKKYNILAARFANDSGIIGLANLYKLK